MYDLRGLIKNMSHEKVKKVLEAIFIINIIFIVIYIASEDFNRVFAFINIASLLTFIFFIIPTFELLKKELNIGKRLSIAIKATLVLYMTFSLYDIMLSKEYEIYLAYWVFIGIVSVFILIAFIDKCKNLRREVLEDKKDRSRKILRFIGVIIVNLLSLLLFIYSPYSNGLYTPAKIVNIGELEEPVYIGVTEIYRDKSKAQTTIINIPIFDEILRLNDTESIDIIISNISNITLENVRNFDEFNYERVKNQNEYYYELNPRYHKDRELPAQSFEEGYIEEIIVLPSGHLFLRVFHKEDRLREDYKVEVSDKLIDKIIKIIENKKKLQ